LLLNTPVKRINSHRVFRRIAKRGKTSTGWFFGFKLHLIINDHGEILAYMLTAGNSGLLAYAYDPNKPRLGGAAGASPDCLS
jgi:hypothetical protein